MGKGFGELARARGIIKYSLSPFEQKAFAGAFSLGIPNMFRRFRGQFLRVVPRIPNMFRRFRGQFLRIVPPFVIGYMVYDYIEKKHTQLLRKNPADFENDV